MSSNQRTSHLFKLQRSSSRTKIAQLSNGEDWWPLGRLMHIETSLSKKLFNYSTRKKKQSKTENTPFEPNFLFNKKNNVNYSNYPSLGEVDLHSPLGNSDLPSISSYAGVVFSKPKSPAEISS